MSDYIKLGSCKKGFLYKVSSRNLDKAVFDGENGFIGIREKLGSKYLFKEYHKDTDKNFGTVLPQEELKKVPKGIPITSQLEHEDGKLWGQRGDTWVPIISRQLRESEAPHGSRPGFVDLWADTGERTGDNEYPRIRGNEKLMQWLEKQ